MKGEEIFTNHRGRTNVQNKKEFKQLNSRKTNTLIEHPAMYLSQHFPQRKYIQKTLGMVAHAYNLSTRESKEEVYHKFKIDLVSVASFRTTKFNSDTLSENKQTTKAARKRKTEKLAKNDEDQGDLYVGVGVGWPGRLVCHPAFCPLEMHGMRGGHTSCCFMYSKQPR